MLMASAEGGFMMSDEEFELLRRHVYEHAGIALGPHKREMLKARLARRVRALGLSTFAAYYRHLRENDSDGNEHVRFVNAVTTNVTSFFREQHHFRYLTEQWLPRVRAEALRQGRRVLRIWSAGCSTGEEPYSIALCVHEALGPAAAAWDLRILASDIDTDVLRRAAEGVYPADRVAETLGPRLSRYFLRGTGSNEGFVRVRPELQALVTFRHINLMADSWPIHTQFDAIFCRNVLIYFDRGQQRRLVGRLRGLLREDGLLFLGHSESLHGQEAGLQHIANTIYQRRLKPA
jgi:chemotaxis protein methyltransferase CheR